MVSASSIRRSPRRMSVSSSRPRLETLETRFAPGSILSGLEADILYTANIAPQANTAVTVRQSDRIKKFADTAEAPALSDAVASKRERLEDRGGGGSGHGSNGLPDPHSPGSLGNPINAGGIIKFGSPTAPKHLTAMVSEDRTGYLFIHLTWVYEELNASHFDVNRAVDHSPFNLIAQVSFQMNKENYDYTDGPVTKGPHYEYCVKAVNGIGKSACARVGV